MKAQFNAQIQILHSENDGEFVNHDFHAYFQQHGIIYDMTCPQTPQQNGVAERKNRHLLKTARPLLIETIDRPNPTIDHLESGARDCSLPKSDQSLDPSNPSEDVYDPSPTPIDNTEQRDADPPSNLIIPMDQSPENILETSKYPIANHVSTEKLFEPLKAVVHQLSVPNQDTGMLDCKLVDTPIVHNHNLGEYPDQVPTNKERYQRLVGRLIYLSHTRPDIAYAVSVISQFMHSPSEDHMNAVLQILRYLKSAPRKGLMFSKHGHLNIDGYTDADRAGSITDRKSTFGYFIFVGGNLFT
ncbi:unnamed protein product [Prunus armeniaca]